MKGKWSNNRTLTIRYKAGYYIPAETFKNIKTWFAADKIVRKRNRRNIRSVEYNRELMVR